MLLLNKLKEKQQGLVIGGDGRSDSPGHSAKYGSYSMLELNLNKIIDIQLVQVICAVIHTHMHIYVQNDYYTEQ